MCSDLALDGGRQRTWLVVPETHAAAAAVGEEDGGNPSAAPAMPLSEIEKVRIFQSVGSAVFEGTFSLLHCAVKDDTLFRASLDRHYYEQRVTDIHDVTCEYGLLFFDVETPRGRESFIVRWQQDRAEDYGEGGKVMLDVYDNRYVIPSVAELTPAAQHRLTKYVYW